MLWRPLLSQIDWRMMDHMYHLRSRTTLAQDRVSQATGQLPLAYSNMVGGGVLFLFHKLGTSPTLFSDQLV